MQPKDGANGIELPGRLSHSLSLLFTSFLPEVQPRSPRVPVRSPLFTQRSPSRWRYAKRCLFWAAQTGSSSPQI